MQNADYLLALVVGAIDLAVPCHGKFGAYFAFMCNALLALDADTVADQDSFNT